MKAFHLFTSYFVSSSSEKNTLSFIETSALDSTNVEEAFKNILTGRKSDGSVWCNVQPTVNLHGNVMLHFTALTFTFFFSQKSTVSYLRSKYQTDPEMMSLQETT